MPKNQEGHSAQRIALTVCEILYDWLGSEWKSTLQCSVTDGASNATKAALSLGGFQALCSTRSAVISEMLCGTQRKVASAMACCNYLERLSSV